MDTSQADKQLVIYVGRAYGQVFLASDTLIQAITVWRPALPETNFTALRLVISEVYPTGEPDMTRILESGPVQRCIYSDGVHPGPCRFELSPPLALPRRGSFYFAIQDAECGGGYYFLADSRNPYPYGQAWFNTVNFDCSIGPAISYHENDDFIFTIEFCDTTTPVRSTTWGQLKTRYR